MTELTQPDWMKGYVPDHTSTRWQKGQSGNPAGRPKGSLNRTDKIARALNEEGLEVVRVVLDAAKAGDMVACGHILNRIAPNLRSKAQTIEFDFDPEAPMTKQIEAVLAGVAAGQVPPDVGQQIISAIGTLNEARLTEELARELEALKRDREVGR